MRKLEETFPDELVIIGVHAGKFPAEKQASNVREAVTRCEIRYPVINDANFTMWRRYSVNAWPTLVLVDPAGNYVGHHAGEMTADQFTPVIQRLVDAFDVGKQIEHETLPVDVETPVRTLLSYPGKLLVDEANRRLFISDTNHNRVLVVTLDDDGTAGDVTDVIGGGRAGMTDGPFNRASFDHPRGLVLVGTTLYVADTENHALRAVDLESRTVTRVAGIGEQGHTLRRGPGVTVALNSPWDLVYAHGVLFIAMAGCHQIWVFDPESGKVGPYVGDAREKLIDGRLSDASLAQPSGLATNGEVIYFVDSETSAVRYFVPDLRAGEVRTLVGVSLFEFGDIDAQSQQARLQHPSGITYCEDELLIADTYNHKIKRLDLATQTVETVVGTGDAGLHDDTGEAAQFYEPNDVEIAGDLMFIADTNNHAIRIANLRTLQVGTLRLRGGERLLSEPL